MLSLRRAAQEASWRYGVSGFTPAEGRNMLTNQDMRSEITATVVKDWAIGGGGAI